MCHHLIGIRFVLAHRHTHTTNWCENRRWIFLFSYVRFLFFWFVCFIFRICRFGCKNKEVRQRQIDIEVEIFELEIYVQKQHFGPAAGKRKKISFSLNSQKRWETERFEPNQAKGKQQENGERQNEIFGKLTESCGFWRSYHGDASTVKYNNNKNELENSFKVISSKTSFSLCITKHRINSDAEKKVVVSLLSVLGRPHLLV